MNKNGIKIASINGAEVLKAQESKEFEIKYNCVIADSLLMDKVKSLEGFNVSKQNITKQIINVKFDYAYKDDDYTDSVVEYKEAKKESKKQNSEINKTNKRIKELKDRVIKHSNKIKENKENGKETTSLENKLLKINKELVELQEKLIEAEADKLVKDENKIEAENNMNSKIYKKDRLRDKLYNEGFELDTYKTVKKEKVFDRTIKYHYWFRTGGKAKNGDDYFIEESLWKQIEEWQRMFIELPKENAKLVEMEVYKSLVSSALVTEGEQYFVCDPDEILVVNDLDCYSDLQDVISVYRDNIIANTNKNGNLIKNSEYGLSKAKHTKQQCKNTIWDGMALIQTENGSTGFRGLRHHMYKTGAFIADFQQYFKDYYKDDYENAYITDMFGRKVKVSTIKMLTTNNAIKWLKFLPPTEESFNKWAKCIRDNDCKFGICKSDHKSKYGTKQRMSYQMVNTLPDVNIKDLFEDSKEYITNLQNVDSAFIEHLKRTASAVNNNDMLVAIYKKNNDFVNSHMFKEARRVEINKYKETLKQGKILVEGENETIVGNPFLLLQYVTGQIDDKIKDGVISGYTDKTLPLKNSCYCRRFNQGEVIGAFRSPHNSMNNDMLFNNTYDAEIMDKYFSCLGKNVIVVNFLYNDVQDRGNGLDTDTDFLLCTTNKTIVDACIKAQEYPTIVNDFEQSTKTYNNTMSDLATIDDGLQCSQKAIGTSSNVAMQYLSQFWDMIAEQEEKEIWEQDYNYYFIDKPSEDEVIDSMLDKVCILSVLAQVSVDSCKRAYKIGDLSTSALNKEIERLRKELPNKEKPTFWQYTSSAFKNDEIEKKLKNKVDGWKKLKDNEKSLLVKSEKQSMIDALEDYYCPVNNILKEIDNIKVANYRKGTKSDVDFIQLIGNKNTQNRKQALKIEQIASDFNSITRFINSNMDLDDDEDNIRYYNCLYKEYMDKLNGLTIKEDTMSLLIARTLDKDNKFLKSNSNIKTKLLNMLFKYNDGKEFMECFIKGKN